MVIVRALARQLGANVVVDGDEGVCFRIFFRGD
jgi:two-component sensor histidine kinase